MKQKNPKQKRSLKDRLKNFFTIPEEVFEEEPSPQFERQKLFNFTRTNIFIGLFLFLLIINALIIFDVNFIYLRQILGFLFLIAVPGIVLMLCFKIRNIGFWEYLVYTVGLSISFIMFAGLIVNWTLPYLGITDKPLSLFPILICFNIFLLVLGFVAYKRNKDFKPRVFSVPKLDTLNNIFFTIPMLFPVLAILGAFLLNNHGPNFLTMIMLGGIAVYVLLLTIFRKRLDKNIWPWALYWMGLSLLLMYSLRSWIFMGSDVSIEYHFFNLILRNGLWNLSNAYHPYNVCLSITILPASITFFGDINPLSVFKLILPIIISLLAIEVYLISARFFSKIISFFGGFFFVSQVAYFVDLTSALRQGIAFVFFGLVILALFEKQITNKKKKLFFLCFFFSIVVSHYTTSYIGLFFFILLFMTKGIHNYFFNRNNSLNQQKRLILNSIVLLIIIAFSFLWYSQITPASMGIIDFLDKSIGNFDNLFKEELQMQGQSFSDQFKLSSDVKDYNKILFQKANNATNTLEDNLLNTQKNLFYPSEIISNKIPLNLSKIFYLFLIFVKKIPFVFIFISILLFLFFNHINNKLYQTLAIMGLVFFFFWTTITIIPFGSIDYGILRLYQQGLILLSSFVFVGLFFVSKKVNLTNGFYLFSCLFLILYLFAFSGFFNQVVGGNIYPPNLNNSGDSYYVKYISILELRSVEWMNLFFNNDNVIYSSKIYQGLWISFGGEPRNNWDVFSSTITKNSYVFLGDSEVDKNKGFNNIQGVNIGYIFPTQFLNENKNKIYNNGGSEIFK
jgi:uncharacterized membrane protein